MISASLPNTLPAIDITPFLSTDPQEVAKRSSTAAALHAACLEFGFFYLNIDAHADRSETEELARLAREFFALPQEEKDKMSLKNRNFARGHAKLYENVTNGKGDAHELLDIIRPVDDETKPVWGKNQ